MEHAERQLMSAGANRQLAGMVVLISATRPY
jgi:hypothetical protein